MNTVTIIVPAAALVEALALLQLADIPVKVKGEKYENV